MARTGGEKPLFPADRAFVVQFRQDGAKGASGRVEHLQTGRSLRFTDAQALLEFMERMLGGPANSDERQEDEP